MNLDLSLPPERIVFGEDFRGRSALGGAGADDAPGHSEVGRSNFVAQRAFEEHSLGTRDAGLETSIGGGTADAAAVLRALDGGENALMGACARAISVPDAADRVAAALLRRLGR